METTPKKYKAFISYSHKDEVFAEWLHEELENYEKLQKEYNISFDIVKNIFPIFRDKEELSSHYSLSEKILEALYDSEYLIIICSTNAVKSKYINQEIIDFKNKNGEKNILPIILNGEPYGGEDECFPEALKYKVIDDKLSNIKNEPISADTRGFWKTKWNYGKIQLLSSLLNIKFSKLYQREKRRKRSSQIIAMALLSFFILFMGALYYKFYSFGKEVTQTRVKTEKICNEVCDKKVFNFE